MENDIKPPVVLESKDSLKDLLSGTVIQNLTVIIYENNGSVYHNEGDVNNNERERDN